MNGRLVILSGPSGVGKDTVLDEWTKINPLVKRVAAWTTRQPRPGEADGIDYHFVSLQEFQANASSGGFLEHKEVHGSWYGTPLAEMEALLAEGRVAVLKIDVQGALTVMELLPDAKSIFLQPPSHEELERRIRGRGTDSEEAIAKRMRNAEQEMAMAVRYQLQIMNVDSVDCAKEINQWVMS